MIKSLYIQNFQSHKKTKLEFSEGVNVIIGSSDSGKSAIIRAINWVITNRPSGDNFRTNGCTKDTVVKIKTTDGNVITRRKGKVNQYKLNDTVFNAFGTDVPDEIKKVLNIEKVNLKKQIDSHYLLSNSSGEVATHFNRIARLDVIDKSLQNINSWNRSTVNEINNIEKQIKEKDEVLTNMQDLDKIEAEVEVLEGIETKITVLGKNIKKLKDTINSIISIDVDIKMYSEILKIENSINNALALFEEQKLLNYDINDLKNKINSIKVIDYKINKKHKIVTLEQKVTKALTIIANEKLISADLRGLNSLVNILHTIIENLFKTKVKVKTLSRKFKKEMGDVCILCGSKL